MADGTTAFSMALAKGRSELIKEFLQHKRSSDMILAALAALEPNINADVKQALMKSTNTHILELTFKPILGLNELRMQLQPCIE